MCKLDLDKGNVEFEVDLFGGDLQSALGVVEGGFHSGGGLVVFALEKPDASEAGKDLGVMGAVFGKGGFILVKLADRVHSVANTPETYTLDRPRVLLQLTVDVTEVDVHACVPNGILDF